ncbi:MAG: flavodoxin family protein [Deltaproteobacteria bacterium]|jgi:multimeric flavodoxin WrbA|nr:flavodoxin family protein [Deltaproteobacteria bacterium]
MIIALNASPRTDWNTATLLGKALEGAQSAGAQTALVHLYSLKPFYGCVSCFACKRKGGNLGHCAMHDELTPLLDDIREADGLILGSPIYWWDVTAAMRAFLERLLFSNMLYNRDRRWVFPKTMPAALIYTWGAEWGRVEPKLSRFKETEDNLGEMLGMPVRTLHSFDALQFDDYSKYEADKIDVAAKTRHREEVFPQDCAKAFDLGAAIAAASK